MGPMRYEQDDIGGLHDLCVDLVKKGSLVVEIGSYWGESMLIFSKFAKRVYCIDPWVDVLETGATKDDSSFLYENMALAEARFDANAARAKNVVKIRGYSGHLAKMFGDKRADLVYIDALHDYKSVIKDINNWWRVVKPNGWLAGHNYGEYWPGVFNGVNENFGKPDKTYKDTSWAVQKKPGRRNAKRLHTNSTTSR